MGVREGSTRGESVRGISKGTEWGWEGVISMELEWEGISKG